MITLQSFLTLFVSIYLAICSVAKMSMVDQQQDFAQYDPSLSLTAPSLSTFRARHAFPRAKRGTSDGLDWLDRVVIIAFMLAFAILCECMKSYTTKRLRCSRTSFFASLILFAGSRRGESKPSTLSQAQHHQLGSVLCSVPADDGDSTDSVADL